jgi:hypothetical protein
VNSPRYLYVTGGRQRKRLLIADEEWNLFERALVLRLDTSKKSAELCVDYTSPPEACPEKDPAFLFKSGSLVGNTLYACTSTEVLSFSLPDCKRVGYISLPCFNDLHHVAPGNDENLVVVNTGLDSVVEVSPAGKILEEWSAIGEDTWQRFSRSVDYRKVPTTKPHKSHPNYAFFLDGELWVTRLQQKDAICLRQPEQRIDIGIEKPHDGVVCNGRIYFTTVDGHLVLVDQKSQKVEAAIDLKLVDNERKALLGWCRGVLPLDERHVWVGFTRIRATKFKENILWLKHAFQETEKPTHIALYDIHSRKLLDQFELEAFDMNVLFSILPAPCN